MEISEARMVHQDILRRLMRGPGDALGAMHKAQEEYGLSYWCQWNLRNKQRASKAFLERLRQAYLAALERSVRNDLRKLEIEASKGGNDASLYDLMGQATDVLEKIQEKRGRG